MRKMGKSARAIGFAVYPDLLERLEDSAPAYDVDTVIIYDEQSDLKMLTDAVKMMTSSGKSVMAQNLQARGGSY